MLSPDLTPVKCPISGNEICGNCGLHHCVYFTQYPGVYNCILVYMARQGLEALSVVDISVLTQIPQKQVVSTLQSALNLLRKDCIGEANAELDKSFATLVNTPICVTCECQVGADYQKYKLSENSYVYYCGDECYNRKPPSVIALEKYSGVHIGAVLQWAIRKYRTLGALEQAIGLKRTLLKKLLRHYLNLDINNLYFSSKRTIKKPQILHKRRGRLPAYIYSFNKAIDKFVKGASKVYGVSDVDISVIQRNTFRVLTKI